MWQVRMVDNKTNQSQVKKFKDLTKAVEYASGLYQENGRGKLKSAYIEKETVDAKPKQPNQPKRKPRKTRAS